MRMRKKKSLTDTYRFPGFRPDPQVRGCFGDPKARILRLVRWGKKRSAARAGDHIGRFTIARRVTFGICHVEILASSWPWSFGAFSAHAVAW